MVGVNGVQNHLEWALECQRIIFEIGEGYEKLKRQISYERDENIKVAVIELLEGDYLQVVFDSILKAIILKVEKEYERK